MNYYDESIKYILLNFLDLLITVLIDLRGYTC